MRYWLLESDEPAGPYAPDDLDQIPGFSRSSLVYPEKRLDAKDERWLLAGDVPQLAVTLAAVERRAFAGRYIVPEPTVRDLPVLGAILKQLDRFEEDLIELRGNLIARHQELVELRGDSDSSSHRIEDAQSELKELEARLKKMEPLEADILHLREASMETAETARQVEKKFNRNVEDVRKRFEALENTVDADAQADAQAEMMRIYTASLQERLDKLGEELEGERKASTVLRGELVKIRSAHKEERSARGFLAGGSLFLVPERVVFFLILALLLAVGYLFFKLRTPVVVPAPVVEPEPKPEPPPPPKPKPVILKPKPKKVKSRVRRKRKSSKKRATQKQREEQVRSTILLRVTGGVPSSKRSAIAERRAKPRPAPEQPKN
ncbi:MAG: hypothetical protein COB53_09715 [Elusimicrobia bacterium]|nr:MAG: hypothetical protein COB53_09715 [Elusimicrobiota bacterium]